MEPAASRKALDGSMVRAVAWNAAAKWLTQVFAWVSTILIARLLSPADYGLFGMAMVYLCFAAIFDQFGIADAILTLRDLTARQVAELNSVAVVQGLCLTVISCGLALPLAHFFKEPRLAPVIVLMSVTYILSGFQLVPAALLRKELRFKLLALIETARQFAQMLAVLLFAWFGFAYWSLAYGCLVATLTSAVLTLFRRRHAFAVPNLPGLRRELRFSGEVVASGITSYLCANGDFLVAGRMLGAQPLGDYTLAWNISQAPIEKVGNLVSGVTPAFFAAIQNDPSELRRYLLRITELLSYVTVPASIGLVLVADLLVPVLLGPKWQGAVGPLRLLGVFIAYRSLNTILPKLLTAIGETSLVMWVSVGSAILMPLSFFVGSRWGTNGIATAWILMYPVTTLPLYRRTFRRIGLSLWAYVSSVLPAMSATAIMTLSVLAVRWALPGSLRPSFRLAIAIATGALAYGGGLLLLYGERVSGLLQALRQLRKAPPSAEEVAAADGRAV